MLRIEHGHFKIVFNVKGGTPVASFHNTYKTNLIPKYLDKTRLIVVKGILSKVYILKKENTH